MNNNPLERAKQLIQAQRYAEAEALLLQINDPKATAWLQQLQEKGLIGKSLVSQEPIVQPKLYSKAKRELDVIVTTGDIDQPYRIISPVYFQISNKGVFSNQLAKLKKLYADEIKQLRKDGVMSESRADFGILWYGEFSAGQNDFESAFFVAMREIQKRAFILKADAIISMRQDIDLDTNGFAFFYLQMYGTAVRFLE